MSVLKRSMLFALFASLVISAVPASAVTITDDTNDVMYFEFDPLTGDEKSLTVVNNPNIDITSVSYTITGSEITLTMKVKGAIEDSDLIIYYIYFGMINETDNSIDKHYVATYRNEESYYSYFTSGGGMPTDSDWLANPVSGNTFTATFEMVDFDPKFEIWGITTEYTIDPMSSDVPFDWTNRWMDFTSNFFDLFPSEDDEDDVDEDEPDIDDDDEDTTDDNEDIILPNDDDTVGDGNGDTGGGTPGFEILVFIVALTISFIILKRKKL